MAKKKSKPVPTSVAPVPLAEPPAMVDRATLWTGLGLALAFLILYEATMYRTIDFGDSGELIAAAYVLGIPHTPGYPLYCLLAKGFMTFLPIGAPAVRVNFMSALPPRRPFFFCS